jgi:hypothetical protein
MACDKCGYHDKHEKERSGLKFCSICVQFAPQNEKQIKDYVKEKLDWKILDTFRKYNQSTGEKLKKGMVEKAQKGKPMSRAPLGYEIKEGKLTPNQDSSKVHSLFKVFLEKDYSLNGMAKHYGLSVNGLKKVLTNRTYLGEIKFAGSLSKGTHTPIIGQELFYAVQRKLKEIVKS